MSKDYAKIPPNARRLVEALRSIGYSFEGAVADIIDNSISAEAQNVLVRLIRSQDELVGVRIVDDGNGMRRSRLEEAMRFGADTEQSPDSLSKFGMGMKIASLSQATSLTVASRRSGEVSAMRWTVTSLADDWNCERLPRAEAVRILEQRYGDIELAEHGTVVCWEHLDRIKGSRGGVDATINRLMARLRQHLGLHLHRFIEDSRLRVRIDIVHEDSDESEATREVEALNPFDHGESVRNFPRTLRMELPGLGTLDMEAHIWPAKATSKNYRLDDAAKRQGLYFYRNDRLIQAGGWNGLRADAEPHLSLARVRVDLPSRYDSSFSLDVKKASIKVPPGFVDAVAAAEDGNGFTFKQYLHEAQKIYRRKERQDPSNHPLVPGTGIAKSAREKIKNVIAPGEARVREVGFEWNDVDDGRLFTLDTTRKTIILSKSFRKRILDGRPPTSTDAPLVKLLLFFLLREDLDRERTNEKLETRLAQIDEALRAVFKTLED